MCKKAPLKLFPISNLVRYMMSQRNLYVGYLKNIARQKVFNI
jgi:hypothetical protein